MRVVPRSLAGQLIVLLLGALLVAQVLIAVIFLDERAVALRMAGREQVLERTAAVVRLLQETPESLHGRVLAAASTRTLVFSLTPAGVVTANGSRPAEQRLATILTDMIGEGAAVHVRLYENERPWVPRPLHHLRDDDDYEDDRDDDDDDRGEDDDRQWDHHPPRPLMLSLAASVALSEGHWLNVETALAAPQRAWASPPLLFTGIMAAAILAIAALTVRRITRPLRAVADAADRLGRGDSPEPLAETGPDEIQRTTRAFNAMQGRLARFVADRTRMLAAISHDLRTPITTLRLRAEFVDDEEARTKILATLDEMSRMTEAALAFTRDEAKAEDTRVVDLAALVQSLVDDLAPLGGDVNVEGPARLPYPCRPTALKRAIRNLIENAVRYGERARLHLAAAPEGPRLTIEDDGPGIPEDRLADVFEPFVRLETSRSLETGGVGLGLAIARSIIRHHGGDLTLANRPDGGLVATIALPPVAW